VTVAGGNTAEEVAHPAMEKAAAVRDALRKQGVGPLSASYWAGRAAGADMYARLTAIDNGQLYKALMRQTPKAD
jgi:hypothetical protein